VTPWSHSTPVSERSEQRIQNVVARSSVRNQVLRVSWPARDPIAAEFEQDWRAGPTAQRLVQLQFNRYFPWIHLKCRLEFGATGKPTFQLTTVPPMPTWTLWCGEGLEFLRVIPQGIRIINFINGSRVPWAVV